MTFHWAASLAALLQFLYHAIQIRIPSAKASCEPVPPSLCDLLAIRHHIELTSLSRRKYHFHIQPILDEVHETRDLYFVVLSRRAVNDFDLHSILRSALYRFDILATSRTIPSPWDSHSWLSSSSASHGSPATGHAFPPTVNSPLIYSLLTTHYSPPTTHHPLLTPKTVSPNRLNPAQLLPSTPLPSRLIRTVPINNSARQ